MAWDHYFIEGGAEHSAEIMRLVPYMILGGQEGVLQRFDCAVSALDTPGGSVNVAPGAVAFLNRTPGYSQQMYLGRLASQEPVAIAPTDSSGSRSDLVVIRSENPISGTGWPVPADPAVGPYFFTRVISNVDPTTTSYEATGGGDSAYALARIDIPASTATITDDMIVDLRRVANPLTGIGGGAEKEVSFITDTPSGSRLAPGAGWVSWPAEATWQVPVPAWATDVEWVSWLTPNMTGHSWGSMRMVFDGTASAATHFDDNFNSGNGGGGQRTLVRSAGNLAVPASMRDRTIEVHLEGTQNATTGGGLTVADLVAGSGTQIVTEFTFKQRPVYS